MKTGPAGTQRVLDLAQQAVRGSRFAESGIEGPENIPLSNPPVEFGAMMRAEMARFAKVIEAANIRIEQALLRPGASSAPPRGHAFTRASGSVAWR